tara:strand:- start:134 stop:541 length:408 start_codon:yes stop_codon:yes gene_type:complete
MGKDYTNKGEYRSPGASKDFTTYPKKKNRTKGEKLKKSGKYIDTGELDSKGKPLMIQRDSTVQQGINRDKTENKEFDKILNPDGKFKRPSLEQLREGADWKRRLLTIGAGGTAIVLEGARKTLQSLLINPLGGAM